MYKVDCDVYLTLKGKPKGKIDSIAWLLLNVFGCKFCETCNDNPCKNDGDCCTERISNYIRNAVKEQAEQASKERGKE